MNEVSAGGHIGLFMGSRTLQEDWLPIAHWISSTNENPAAPMVKPPKS